MLPDGVEPLAERFLQSGIFGQGMPHEDEPVVIGMDFPLELVTNCAAQVIVLALNSGGQRICRDPAGDLEGDPLRTGPLSFHIVDFPSAMSHYCQDPRNRQLPYTWIAVDVNDHLLDDVPVQLVPVWAGRFGSLALEATGSYRRSQASNQTACADPCVPR